MKEKIKNFFCILVLLLALPYIFTTALQGKPQEMAAVSSQPKEQEEYLIGRVALDIPVSYEEEAIKAQAVIARTSFMAAKENGEELPEAVSREELLKLWGSEEYGENYQKIAQAVEDTAGMVMTYQGEYIYAAFHAVSAGVTRAAQDAFKNETMPWLQQVESPEDIPSQDYLKVLVLEKEEFKKELEKAFSQAAIDPEHPLDGIQISARDSAQYVTEVKISDQAVSGEEFRNALQLPSACFYMKEVEGNVRIVSKGLGHGLGMSQYGANEMAKKGAACQEILTHYFKNIEISD